MRLPKPVRLVVDAVKAWSKDDVPRLGASLAYYTLFSLAPVLLIVIAIAGFIFGEEVVRGEVVDQVGGLAGEEGARGLQALLQAARRERAGALATVIGGVTFLIAATGAFLELQHALNVIFGVKTKSDGFDLKELVKDRLRSFGLVVSIGFLLMVSLAVSAALAAAAAWVERVVGGAAIIWQVSHMLVSLTVITALFALIYRFLPDVRLRWADIWVGALGTATLFTIGKQLIGLYLGRTAVASSYGAIGSVVVLLLWVYYSAQVVLLGAELTRVYARSRGWEPAPTQVAEVDPDRRPSQG